MHLYNAWLPPPVSEQTVREKESFAGVVKAVKESYRVDDPESVYATLKWISVLDLFVNAKSDLLLEDVTELVELGLQLFKVSDNKLYAQVRWGNVLVRFLNKYRKTLTLKIQWRPFYDTLVHTHFTRNTGPEGWRLRQRHFEMVTALVRVCRRFFPPGSAFEIWSEFRLLLENPWHNSCFEGSGFLRLFLPTNLDNQDFFSQEWFKVCLYHWDSVPNCQFWNSQWLSITARVIKNYNFIDWKSFLPTLFNRYLSVFEVPVANGGGLNPFSVDVPRNTKFLFSNRTATPGKAIAKSIIYLLKPDGLAQQHFEKLVNLLEQYYHPSNGGRWTFSLERFLFYLVTMFLKRLQHDQMTKDNGEKSMLILQQADRVAFVHVLLKFIDRGQYSKYENLAETVAAATSMLSYVEPSLVLPFLASRFHMALETATATHQLKSAVTSVAFAGRSLFLTASSTPFSNPDDAGGTNSFIDLLTDSLSNALLGIDANDPPKTLATMQLIGSLFSNMAVLEDDGRELSPVSGFHFSEWLDEFLCRLFSLLQHLEPSSVMSEGISSPATAGTFLVEDGPYYFCMLEILLARLSGPLYKQALNKITRFVMSNVLPGAIAEVGLLCCACVHTNPEEAVTHLVQPLLVSAMSSLRGTPNTGYGGRRTSDTIRLSKEKAALSPALEVSIEYQLKVLSVAISYGGPALLRHKDEFKEIIFSAFDSTSWKVNGAGDHVLRSLLGSLILYYPTDQYKSISCHPVAIYLEDWISTKDLPDTKSLAAPKWHIPCHEEVQFATELLHLHFDHALDDLQQICQSELHSDSGNEKEHLKVTLLRVDSSLQGVLSCLPDLRPTSRNKMAKDLGQVPFLIAGATGSIIGTTELREKATLVIHATCKYLLVEKSDDSILLLLVIRIMDALGNYGSSEYEEWLNHKQAWKLESAAIVEPPVNFIVSSHSKGKRRPRWALIDKTYMHSTWRSSQACYHLFHTLSDVSPSEHVLSLVNDLLNLSLHSYETVRLFAGKALVKIMKRWPSTISNCVHSLSENLRSSTSPEHVVLGSCAVLSTQTVIKRLTMDTKALSSFLFGILSSSHHESLKAQKAINELFVKYNIYFSGVSMSIFRASNKNSDVTDFSELVSKIGSLSFESSNLHWRYNLMANRILLLLAMASKNDPNSSEILSHTAGHFLKNLKSDLPQTRILAISALNILLKESPYKAADAGRKTKSLLEESLTNVFQEQGFFKETLSSLSHVHIITDADGTSARGNAANSSFQSLADKSITRFYFDFSASWPRTPNWISVLSNETFYSNFAKIFKRLVQECGYPVLTSLKNVLEEFVNAKERSRQCVAAEALAGVVHSDVYAVSEVWDSWVIVQLQNIVHSPSVESIPEWAACIRYAVTGKGKNGTRAPFLRERVMDCLMNSLDMATSTTSTVVAKRYTFLAAALIEISPPRMTASEMQLHLKLLEELLGNMNHSSAQVRESIGVTLSVVCSNIRLHASFIDVSSDEERAGIAGKNLELENWDKKLIKRASDLVMVILDTNPSDSLEAMIDKTENGTSKDVSRDDINWMETMFHFIVSSLKSGRSSVLLDVIVGLLYPMVSLQETSNKDLATLAKAAFELLKWRVFYEPHLQTAVSLILSSASDTNWRTRSATLTFMRTFMYRHAFILPKKDEKKIWSTVEKLLTDNQIEVREHAAAVLAGLMKSGNWELAEDFRHKALEEANILLKKRRQRNIGSGPLVASVHGSVLSLAASVLSVPYDMPSWLPEHVTLLARFISEPSPVKSTVTKAVADFRRTHADTWSFQKDAFTEEQLEILADTSSSSSYFA